MENGDEGSSTESEYYDLSDDDEPKTVYPTKILNLGGDKQADAGANDPELVATRTAKHGDHGMRTSVFTGMSTQWNNIFTPDLAAAVARVTAHATRDRAPPPQVAVPDGEMQFPHSNDFVSPFAALAKRTAAAETEENEATEPHTPALSPDQELETEQEQDDDTRDQDDEQDDFEILETTPVPVSVPARVVIDLSLDSDDDEEDEVLCRRISTTAATVAAPASSRPLPHHIECPDTETAASSQSTPRHTTSTVDAPAPVVSEAAPRRIVLLFPRPPDPEEESSGSSSLPLRPETPIQATHRPTPAATVPTPGATTLSVPAATTISAPATRTVAPPAAAAPALRVELTLSCNRCRRLVPDHSAAPPERARYDCKCCGRKYAQEELSCRGANRRCLFCKPLEPATAAGQPPASGSAASVSPQPWTPLSAEDAAAAHEASISPAVGVMDPSPRAATRLPPQAPHASKRLVSPGSSIVSRPSFPLLSSPRPVVTCVTCHQQLFSVRSLASVQRELDPWFCTCCQRLLCKNESPPDTGAPLRSGASTTSTKTPKPNRILRCASCAIAACDLDSQLKARRPHLESLAELRRFSHILQNLMANHVRQLRAAHREAHVHALQDTPIKREIDQRFSLWKRHMLQLRHQQRQTLRRENVGFVQYRAMFKEQLALEKEEVDVRSRLVAFLAVTLQSQHVKLPREVRGIADESDGDAAKDSSVEELRASPRHGQLQARGGTAAASQLTGAKRDAGQSDGQDARGNEKKVKKSRHVDVRYLQYQPDRKGSER